MLSSVESKKVRGKCYNTEGKVLTTVVFPEAGGPRTQILGAMEQGHANVKMQNSKKPNQFPTLGFHNISVATMKQLFQLPQWRLGDWAPLGKKGGTENQGQLGPPLISMVNEINTLTMPLGEIDMYISIHLNTWRV